jgi:methylase of polypeptide subunit release factors
MDLGCGDGITACRLAESMPNCNIIGVTRERCEVEAANENLSNIELAEGTTVEFK